MPSKKPKGQAPDAEDRKQRVFAAYDAGRTQVRNRKKREHERKHAMQMRDDLQGNMLSHRQTANAIVHYVFRNTELEDYHATGVPIDDARMKSLMVSSCKRMCEVLTLMAEYPDEYALRILCSHMMGAHNWYADEVDVSELLTQLRDFSDHISRCGAGLTLRRSEHATLCEESPDQEYICDKLGVVTVMGMLFCAKHDPARKFRKTDKKT